ncbi:DNA-3-methyladenine glycosylase I [Alkaliphilus crotonatoxidans]
MEERRCPWAKTSLDIEYHDNAWGKPVHDDALLFEMLILEGMQAGLSWNTILTKRETMREAFDGFDATIIARYDQTKKDELLLNPGIIRNRAKINALVTNAQAFLKLQQEHGTFDKYIWSFVDHKPIINSWTDPSQVPAKTEISDAMSKALIAHGFKFVGSTICYAYMQAVGMVNDHMVWCKQYHQCR